MKNKRQIVRAVCLTAALLCFLLAMRTHWGYQSEQIRYEHIRQAALKEAKEPERPTGADILRGQEKQRAWKEPFALKEEQLLAKNPDYACWIYIPGTIISYPVTWREADNAFYLTHGFDGEKASCGSLFADGAYEPFSEHVTVIHGHNMRDGSMFGSLKQYLNRDFLQEFPYIYVCRAGMWKRFIVFDCMVRPAGKVFDGLLNPEREELMLVTCRGKRQRLMVRAFLDEGEMQ